MFAIDVPRIGVVAELATQRTAHHKGYEPDARTVNSAEGFNGVYLAFCHVSFNVLMFLVRI